MYAFEAIIRNPNCTHRHTRRRHGYMSILPRMSSASFFFFSLCLRCSFFGLVHFCLTSPSPIIRDAGWRDKDMSTPVPRARLHDRLACLYNFIYGFFLLRALLLLLFVVRIKSTTDVVLVGYTRPSRTWHTRKGTLPFDPAARLTSTFCQLIYSFFSPLDYIACLRICAWFFFFSRRLIASCVAYELMILNCLCAYIQLLGGRH